MRDWLRVSATALLLLGAACGDDEVTPDAQSSSIDAMVTPTIDASAPDALVAVDASAPDAISFDADPNAPDATPPPDAMLTCTINGFTANGTQNATYLYTAGTTNDAGALVGHADNLKSFNFQTSPNPSGIVTIELYYDRGASSVPHTFTFMDENFSNCHTCSQAILGGKNYLAIFGTLTVTENASSAGGDAGVPSGNFNATLTNIIYQEVTIDSANVSTKVPGGDVWCVPTMNVNVAVSTQ